MSKYYTFSFDDGVTQDIAVTKIFRKYGFYGCTFFLNTGLLGASWPWVGEQFGRPDVTHLRFTEEQLKTGIYDGFDVAVHTLHHPSLSYYDDTPEKITEEVQEDANNIKRIFGCSPVGMSWPGGEFQCTEKTIKTILETTDIRYSRGVESTYDYRLPDNFMIWRPTCSFSDERVLELAEKFISLKTNEDALFYVWCHAYELDFNDSYGKLETLTKMMTEATGIKCVNNTEFYNLFKAEK
ncbi:MAG: polysaccharide deacetylase family protein [Clostridia bacterium]|nr:polysaccharide deacetylase family protein [Clostridia bacterium]